MHAREGSRRTSLLHVSVSASRPLCRQDASLYICVSQPTVRPKQSAAAAAASTGLLVRHLLLPLCLSCHSLMADLRARLGVRRLSDSGRLVMGDVLWLAIHAAIAMRSYLHHTHARDSTRSARVA